MGKQVPPEDQEKYFFPPSTCKDNLVFMRFPLRLAYLAATCHSVFADIFSPATRPDCKDSFLDLSPSRGISSPRVNK